MPYEIEDFTPEDLPQLNLAMQAFPHVAYGLRALIAVTSRLSFPVSSPEDIARAIEQDYLRYGESEIPVAELPTLMPAYYFPIESPEDFLAKVADVCIRVREPAGRNLASTLMEATAPPPDESPPDMSVDDVMRMGRVSEGPAVPSAGGLRQRAG